MTDTPMRLEPDAPRPKVSSGPDAEILSDWKHLEKLAEEAGGPDLQGNYHNKKGKK